LRGGSNFPKLQRRIHMSKYAGMSPKAKRAWGVGIVLFFVVMCGAIGFSQWWAYTHNVPYYESLNKHAK
jgi:hypothetical protein